MALDSLCDIKDVPNAGDIWQTNLLDHLFEPSPELHSILLPVVRTPPHASYAALIDACHARLLSLAPAPAPAVGGGTQTPSAALLSVLGSHPRLGAKRVDSAASREEQKQLQGENEELQGLNAEYERVFPGLRFVSFVDGRPRDLIMEEMRQRIERGDYGKEVEAALQAMCDIAKDRVSKLPQERR